MSRNLDANVGLTEARLLADIELAMSWCNASKVIESPGDGEGWRHTCYRLAMEVKRLRAMSANDPVRVQPVGSACPRCGKQPGGCG